MKANKFGKALVVARLQAGINEGREIRAGELAKKLGVSSTYLSLLEHGRKMPNIAMLKKIVSIYPKETISMIHESLGIK